MHLILISLMIFISVSLLVYAIISSRVDHGDSIRHRLKCTEQPSSLNDRQNLGPASGKWLKKNAAPTLAKMIKPKSEKEQTRLRVKLARAGFRGEGALVIFLSSKIVLGLFLLIVFFLCGAGNGFSVRNLFGLAAVGGGFGFLLPDLWLFLVSQNRQEKITQSLPDCLDLMVICVESGLGLDAAMQRVNQEMIRIHPELTEEFALVSMEVQMGIIRAEAMNNLAMRTGVSEIKSMVALLIQAERFGTSIATALRIHSDSLRIKRSQAAEERAAKTTVKLIFPLVFFIFPAIFVVLAGPAVLKLWENLTNGSIGMS